jgi:hypothetical protein
MSYNVEAINTIIELLKMIDADETISIENESKRMNPLINAVVYLADEHLTCEINGKRGIQQIKNSGFDVFPGEQDRYGWLTGCIQMKRGVIVFG